MSRKQAQEIDRLRADLRAKHEQPRNKLSVQAALHRVFVEAQRQAR